MNPVAAERLVAAGLARPKLSAATKKKLEAIRTRVLPLTETLTKAAQPATKAAPPKK